MHFLKVSLRRSSFGSRRKTSEATVTLRTWLSRINSVLHYQCVGLYMAGISRPCDFQGRVSC